MRKLRKISKEYYLRQIVACWTICSMMLLFAPTRIAMADPPPFQLPQGYELVTGAATPDYSGGGLYIRNLADGTIIKWKEGFNIGSSTFTDFQFITAGGRVLNRDVTGNMSQIYGMLTANGSVWIINPAGVIFGKNAQINVSQLVASSLDILDSDFLDGAPYEFIGGADAGNVTWLAQAHNIDAERLYLIGKNVFNFGGLRASDCVVMAAGDRVLVSEPDSSVVVEAFMPEGWESLEDWQHSGDGHLVWNDGYEGINVDKNLADPDGDGSAQVILAAGDIWSTSLIKAYSNGGSDAVVTVDIVAAGNASIQNDVIAEAVGDGEYNASATINVEAGGNAEVTNFFIPGWPPSSPEVRATARGGLNNTATVGVSAGGNFDVTASWANAQVIAEAYGECTVPLSNQANVNINTGGNTNVKSTGGSYGCGGFTPNHALVEARAQDALNSNDAGVGITTGGDLMVVAQNGGKAEVEAKAINSAENTATVIANVGGNVGVKALCEDQPSSAEIMALAKEAYGSETNTSLVDITAGGNVEVIAEKGGKAEITAVAKDGPTNKSDVRITAEDVIVKAEGGDYDDWWTLNTPENWDVQIKEKIVDASENWDVRIKEWIEDSPEYWKWKFKRCHCGCEYRWITTYDEVQPPPDPSWGPGWSYVHHSKKYYKATGHYNYDWIMAASSRWPSLPSGWDYADDYYDPHPHSVHHPEEWHWGYDWMYAQSSKYPSLPEGWYYANKHYDPYPYYYYHPATYDYHTSFTPSYASIDAIAEDDLHSNTANVLINADGDTKVMAFEGGEAEVIAEARDGVLNTSDVTINSNGDVKVIAKGGAYSTEEDFTESDASIKAKAKQGLENTATIGINAVGGDVLVLGKHGGEAAITALAKDAASLKTNTAKVNINATKVEYTETVLVDEGDPETTDDDVYEEVTYTEGGNVKVIAKCKDQPSKAEIEALAMDGMTNNADVLICLDGGVLVKGEKGGVAEIEALAIGCDAITNTATVGIGAKGEEGIEVTANRGGDASIASMAKYGETNTSSTIVCTQGGVDVLAKHGGDAAILSQAQYGYTTDAYVGVCAVGDIVIQAGEMCTPGCDAVIRAEATAPGCPVESSADAETVVVSQEGNVEVLAYHHGNAGIEAEARGAHLNTAKVGVAAGADLTPAEAAALETGNVLIEALGCGSEALILAYAHDAAIMYPTTSGEEVMVMAQPAIPGENTAQTVVCASGEVLVENSGGFIAGIGSAAFNCEGDAQNSATTQVYSDNVEIIGKGAAIGSVTFDEDGLQYHCWTEAGELAETDGSAIVIIDSYANRTDCPDCPPCPCEEGVAPSGAAVVEAAAVIAPVAPLPVYEIPRVEGCPELTLAAATELGIPSETLQIGMGNALAINPNIQPCQACASLINAASILKDVDGSRMAAMLQVFNAMAPADAPYTPEMATSIAMAFEDAAEGSQYASAMEFVDAFVQYATALDELGSPVGDSMAFVMSQYGAGLSDNSNMATFVAERIENR
jgi:filamentous hemagglutinin family protein